jgi:DNA polymerase
MDVTRSNQGAPGGVQRALRHAVIIGGPAPEDAQERPCWAGWRLLDKMLAVLAGAGRREVITNPGFCRPPANRTPTAEEQLACAPFLERAIELVRPKVLLLVGGAAAKSLLDKSEGILALRGRWFEWRASTTDLEIPALPTLHPAFLLRQPAAKKKVWQDLLRLAERVDRSERPD